MENLESKYVSDYSNKNINRYTYNGEKPSLKHSSTKPEYMNQGKIIIISGPSASGKSAIIDSLVSLNKNYIKATPATSRNKRPGEKPNQDYYFLSEQEFVQKINNDVKSHCPFAYVLFIEFYDFFEVCDVASSAYLPHSGKSRLGCEAGTVMKFVFIPFVYCWRTGSD